MKKRRLLFGLAAALIFASSLTAQAEDRKGASGWQVAFDGKKMKSNFNSSKINDLRMPARRQAAHMTIC